MTHVAPPPNRRRPYRALLFSAVFAVASCQAIEIGLPDASRSVAARDDDGRLVVVVTRDAQIFHGGKNLTLDELAEVFKIAWAGRETQILLRPDADARWCHVQWVLTVAAEHCRPPVEFAVQRDGQERTLRACNHRGTWATLYDHSFATFSHISVEILTSDGNSTYRMGERETTNLRQLRRWIREVADLAGPSIFAIEASMQTPALQCLAVLDAFPETDVTWVTWGLQAPHPWVRDQRRLPEPPEDGVPLVRWLITDIAAPDVVPMSLPVASWAEDDLDNDPQARVIVNLDRKGQLVQKRRNALRVCHWTTVSLAELRAILDEASRSTGYENAAPDGTRASKLYVLLRADKDTPWRHVKWILAVLREAKIYKLQFGVTRSVDLSYTEKEARQLNATRRSVLPGTGDLLAEKLPCFLRTSDTAPKNVVDVILRQTAQGEVVYRYLERETRDLKVLTTWIANRQGVSSGESVLCGRITASDEVPFKYVVAVVSRFAAADVGSECWFEIQFTDIAPVPSRIRRLMRFPH